MKCYAENKYLYDWIDDSVPSTFDDADIIVLPGGADISPSFYNQKAGKYTRAYKEYDDRDCDLLMRAIKAKKFIVGICRGAQLACAIAGGKLIQHVGGHAGRGHHIIDIYKKTIYVNSLHHQMMFPYDLPKEDYKLIAWSQDIGSCYWGEDDKPIIPEIEQKIFKEPEIVYFNKINTLAYQMHPEMENNREVLDYHNDILHKSFKEYKKQCEKELV